MFAYINTYRIAYSSTERNLEPFRINPANKARHSIKAGNLAISFLGLCIHSGEEFLRRSAELGMLAAMFDLVSDGLDFDAHSMNLFRPVVRKSLDAGNARILWELMERKQAGAFGLGGLERGIGAFQGVINHLKSERVWQNDADVVSTGLLLQVVDDLLDYRQDAVHGNLNFLCDGTHRNYLTKLIEWDYERRFSSSQYPLVLFRAIRRAKREAVRFADAFDEGDPRTELVISPRAPRR